LTTNERHLMRFLVVCRRCSTVVHCSLLFGVIKQRFSVFNRAATFALGLHFSSFRFSALSFSAFQIIYERTWHSPFHFAKHLLTSHVSLSALFGLLALATC